MRYLELFAGAGGLSMGLEAAGMTAVSHAEIEPHARAVLRHHWPDVPLHGDVGAVDWTQYAGRVDLVAGGSPCQDLSVAGKRAGLVGARSGLFYEQLRAWDETQALYLLWENVDGARSSNKGADFAAILSSLVGAVVPTPRRWTSAGVVAGETGVAAWRVLDLQHFGPPQRRRRLFVVAARTGGADPAEILALTESLCGHPSPRERSRQDVTGSLSARTRGGGGLGTDFELSGGIVDGVIPLQEIGKRTGVSTTDVRAGIGIGSSGDPMYTLQAGAQHGVFAFEARYCTRDNKTGGAPSDLVKVDASIGKNGDAVPLVVGVDISPTLRAMNHDQSHANGGGQVGVLAFGWQNSKHQGASVSEHITPSLDKSKVPAVVVGVDIAPTLLSRDYKGPGSFRDGAISGTEFPAGRPRRLMPIECERLMSWPDGHTATGTREDGTTYALSDTARYRLCGNGVGSVVAEWIGRQMMERAS